MCLRKIFASLVRPVLGSPDTKIITGKDQITDCDGFSDSTSSRAGPAKARFYSLHSSDLALPMSLGVGPAISAPPPSENVSISDSTPAIPAFLRIHTAALHVDFHVHAIGQLKFYRFRGFIRFHLQITILDSVPQLGEPVVGVE